MAENPFNVSINHYPNIHGVMRLDDTHQKSESWFVDFNSDWSNGQIGIKPLTKSRPHIKPKIFRNDVKIFLFTVRTIDKYNIRGIYASVSNRSLRIYW